MSIVARHEAKDRFRVDIRGHQLVVDQPGPAGGDAGPAPTELFVASLAGCAAFFARRFLARHGLPDGELAVTADYTWSSDHARVERIALHVEVPTPLEPEIEAGLLRTIARCTVEVSIRAQPVITRDVVVPSKLLAEARYP